jgi:hypothetical protein
MSNTQTREEHLKWCKDRAIQEYDFYTNAADKQRNGLTSMMSDLGKHPETNSDTLRSLCMMKMMSPMTRQQFINFINGFN